MATWGSDLLDNVLQFLIHNRGGNPWNYFSWYDNVDDEIDIDGSTQRSSPSALAGHTDGRTYPADSGLAPTLFANSTIIGAHGSPTTIKSIALSSYPDLGVGDPVDVLADLVTPLPLMLGDQLSLGYEDDDEGNPPWFVIEPSLVGMTLTANALLSISTWMGGGGWRSLSSSIRSMTLLDSAGAELSGGAFRRMPISDNSSAPGGVSSYAGIFGQPSSGVITNVAEMWWAVPASTIRYWAIYGSLQTGTDGLGFPTYTEVEMCRGQLASDVVASAGDVFAIDVGEFSLSIVGL